MSNIKDNCKWFTYLLPNWKEKKVIACSFENTVKQGDCWKFS